MLRQLDKLTRTRALARWFTLILILGLPTVLVTESAWARQSGDRHERSGKTADRSEKRTISQGQAANIAVRRFGGKVLKIRRVGNLYRIKLVQPSGHVKQISIDASSGAIVGS
ncbi:MAG: hypothetical protein P8Y45_21110 [Exilibacterium sp.]